MALRAFGSEQTLNEVNHHAPHDNSLAKVLVQLNKRLPLGATNESQLLGRISKE
ncbi:TPA: hypothetical protein ACS78C_003681 [Providencia alcalifaciens]